MSVCFQFEAIGTHWQIELAFVSDKERGQRIESLIRARIEAFERVFSRFRSDSLVSQVTRAAGTYEFPPEAEALFKRYRELYEQTEGFVTPLIGRALVEAGYDAQYSFQTKAIQSTPVWDDVLEYRAPFLTTRAPVQLDFGAAGKGYLVDLIGRLLEDEGIDVYTIDAGGDMRYRAEAGKTLRVGLEHPEDATQVIGVVTLPSGKSICGSAGNRRAWGMFHHILNPKTLTSPRHLLAVWVVAETTLLADSLTTGLFFVSAEKLLEKNAFSYLLLFADYSVEMSPDFPAELFVS